MDVPLAVLADYANVSREGKLNIMGIFQVVNAPALPFPLPQMFLVFVCTWTAADRGTVKNIVIRALDADGGELLHVGVATSVPADAPLVGQTQSVIGLNGLIFQRAGDYGFNILINDEPKAHVGLTVVHATPQLPAAP